MLKTKHKIIIVGAWFVILVLICVMSAKFELNKIDNCAKLRIRAFNQKDFTWSGIVEQNSSGTYQPKCL